MDFWIQLARFARFETQRLQLRPFQYTDFQDFHTIANDTENLSFVFPESMTKSESQYLLTHAFMKEPLGVWLIQEKKSHKMIGAIRLEKYDAKAASAEIGYFLSKVYWGQGLMPEALKTIVFLAFQEFGLKKLVIITHLENEASQKVAQKAGFKLKKRFKGSDKHSHKVRDYLHYQITIGDCHHE